MSLCGEAEWHEHTSGPLCQSLSLCLFQSFCLSSWSRALIYDLFFLKSPNAQRKEGGGGREEGGGQTEGETESDRQAGSKNERKIKRKRKKETEDERHKR